MKQVSYFLIFVLVAMVGCNKNSFEDSDNPDGGNPTADVLNEDIFTPDFNYQMGGAVRLDIQDVSADATYTLYTFNNDHTESETVEVTGDNDEIMEFDVKLPKAGCFDVIGSVQSQGNGIEFSFDIPNDIEELYVQKKDSYGAEVKLIHLSTVRPIERTVVFEQKASLANKAAQATNYSVLWGLNGDKDLFTVDLEYPNLEDAYTLKDAQPLDDTNIQLEEGSWTIAMDDANTSFYTIGKDAFELGYPLYQYHLDPATMTEGNGEVQSFEIVGWLDFTGPRLEYYEGFLYFSTNRKIIQMIPTGDGNTVRLLETAPIIDLNNKSGGDIVRMDELQEGDPEEWYMATFGGLYQLNWDPNQGVVANRKSADNLGWAPTSIAMSKHQGDVGNVYLADNGSPSTIYSMDRQTGAYEAKYSLAHRCNDLTCANAETAWVPEDKFPEDNRYYEVNFPSKYGWGSLAFEDQYPLMVDYDFNDLVIDYRYDVYYTGPADPTIHSMDLYFYMANVSGANFENGFGFTFTNVRNAYIQNVEFERLPNAHGNYQLDFVGYEADNPNADDAVFMVFGDQHDYKWGGAEGRTIKMTITFSSFAINEDFYNGFNPFIIVDGDRELEVHLPGKAKTQHANMAKFRTFHGITESQNLDNHEPPGDIGNLDNDYRGYKQIGDYVYHGFPWALNLPHKFYYPKEEAPITAAYPKFKLWANLNQLNPIDDYDHDEDQVEMYEDWYTDKNGYRAIEWIEKNR